ncbi:MAG: IS1634 family transposase [Symbiobacteriaceae bacterium]|nr:IS1634 family transposase [Symbiobacteriaceae bacterium]
MNLKVGKSRGRKYLSIVHGVWDPASGIVKTKTIQSLGYLDELEKQFADPIAHFREVARQMTEEENARRKVTLSLDMDERISEDTRDLKNLGYAAILKLYHSLDLNRFFANAQRHEGFSYNVNSIMILLVISRILSPGSKKKAFEEKDRYFERFDFSLVDIYRALSFLAKISSEVQQHIHEMISSNYGRDTRVVFYDVTNFYFEIDAEDDLRKRGVSKEKRSDPIVQMGLAIDADGIPLHYKLFEGSLPDTSTFRDCIGEIRLKYDTGRIIVVADRGIISGDNIYYLIGGESRKNPLNGYVFSYSIRGSTSGFKQFVLDPKGYRDMKGKPVSSESEFMIKSRRESRVIHVTQKDGRKKQVKVAEKHVVFWSRKHAEKSRREREKLIAKAMAMLSDPQKLSRAKSYGAAKYIQNYVVNEETGEAILSGGVPIFDYDRVREEEQFDGYYAIVTSEMEMSDQEVVDTYRGLWEIEETFRVTKGVLEARPIHLSRKDRIESHFLICYIALVIMRLLQKSTGKRFSSEQIAECLQSISCMHVKDSIYRLGYRSHLSDEIGKALGIDFTKKFMRLADIKSLVAESKRQMVNQ